MRTPIAVFPLHSCLLQIEKMAKFIELPVAADEDGSETKVQLINIASIGRVYANPQSNRKSIVELNYQSINDAPVFLEVVMPYEVIRQLIAANT
jgi:hypothetical protein